ncbi:MAG: metallophosphoesterase [Melioribacteraceae bacterium]|nr:metallophosphoesterase [Melioribacteraceae bacterium]
MFFLSRIDPFVVFILITVYSGLHFFIYYSFVYFFNISKRPGKILVFSIVLFLGLSFLLAFSLPRALNYTAANVLSSIFPIWIGIFPVLISSLSILWIIKWISKKIKLKIPLKILSVFSFIAPVIIIAYGIWISFYIEINEVLIPVKNLPSFWNNKSIVHLTDLHLRSENQIEFVNKIVDKINGISPELVVITGDFIDRGSKNVNELLSPFKRISVPILFTTGNHDRYSSLVRSFEELKINYIKILHNELYVKEGLQIIGLGYPHRDDRNPADILANDIPLNPDKPTILLYHTPTTIDKDNMGDRYVSPNTDFSIVKNAGIDIQLSGHTHGGQFFPFSLITPALNNGYDKGLHREGSFSLFVSTGLGTWGPPVRTFIPPEIAVIHLTDR